MFSNRFDKVIDTRAIDSIESSIRNVHRFERVIDAEKTSIRKSHRCKQLSIRNCHRSCSQITVKLQAKESTS